MCVILCVCVRARATFDNARGCVHLSPPIFVLKNRECVLLIFLKKGRFRVAYACVPYTDVHASLIRIRTHAHACVIKTYVLE